MVNSQQAAACSGASTSQGRSSDTPPACELARVKHRSFTDRTSGRAAVYASHISAAQCRMRRRQTPSLLAWQQQKVPRTCGGGRAGCEAGVQQPVARPAVQCSQGLQRQPQHRAVRQRLQDAASVKLAVKQ